MEENKPPNELCLQCMKWKQFGEKCRVYWEGKSFCTMKVQTQEDWDIEANFLK